MYIVINKTKNTTTTHIGDFPKEFVENLLNSSHTILVISLYSNTIKIPYLNKHWDDESGWSWREFDLPVKELGL